MGQVNISVQIKRLSTVRKRVVPDTAKFLDMLNDSLAQYGKSISMDELLKMEANAECDLLTAEAYGRLLGSNICFESVSRRVGNNPSIRLGKLNRAIAKHNNHLAILRGIDVEKPPYHRISLFSKKQDDGEGDQYHVDLFIGSGDVIEFEHIRLGMIRLVEKALDGDQEELEALLTASKSQK